MPLNLSLILILILMLTLILTLTLTEAEQKKGNATAEQAAFWSITGGPYLHTNHMSQPALPLGD